MEQIKTAEFGSVEEVLETIKKQKPNEKQKKEWKEALMGSLSLLHLCFHFLDLFKEKIFDAKDGKIIFESVLKSKDEDALREATFMAPSLLKEKAIDFSLCEQIVKKYINTYSMKRTIFEDDLTPEDVCLLFKAKLLSREEITKWGNLKLKNLNEQSKQNIIYKFLKNGIMLASKDQLENMISDTMIGNDISQMTRLVAELYGTKHISDQLLDDYFNVLLFEGKTTDFLYAIVKLEKTGVLTQQECRVMHNMDVLKSNFKPKTVEQAMKSPLYSEIVIEMLLNSLDLSILISEFDIETKTSSNNLFDVAINVINEAEKNHVTYAKAEIMTKLIEFVEAYYYKKFLNNQNLKQVKDLLIKEDDWLFSQRLENFECLFEINSKIFSDEDLKTAKKQFINQIKEQQKNQDLTQSYSLISNLDFSMINWSKYFTPQDKKLIKEITTAMQKISKEELNPIIEKINAESILELQKRKTKKSGAKTVKKTKTTSKPKATKNNVSNKKPATKKVESKTKANQKAKKSPLKKEVKKTTKKPAMKTVKKPITKTSKRSSVKKTR